MEKISLISRVRAGDRKAFDELCRKYYAMLVSYARLFLKDDWAEDVVQDVFYNVWQRRETLDDSNSLYKYLLRSVYNRSLNYLDKNRRAGEYGAYYRERIAALGSSYYAPDNSPVVQKLYNDDLRASLDAAIESLPPKCREVFRLSYIEDLSNREIGEQLGISPRTVENHMYAALKQLRRKLSRNNCCCCFRCSSCGAYRPERHRPQGVGIHSIPALFVDPAPDFSISGKWFGRVDCMYL